MIRGEGGMGAALSQILAQTLTSWALLAHVVDWSRASIFVAVPLVAAIAVPFRHDGSARDRALGNFAAAVVVSGILWWEVLLDALDGLIGDGGVALGPTSLLLLVGTVLFTVAGGLFWVRRDRTAGGGTR
jgi:hypothetical protein